MRWREELARETAARNLLDLLEAEGHAFASDPEGVAWTFPTPDADTRDLLTTLRPEVRQEVSRRACTARALVEACEERGLSLSWTEGEELGVAFEPEDVADLSDGEVLALLDLLESHEGAVCGVLALRDRVAGGVP